MKKHLFMYLKSDKTAQRDSSGTNFDLKPAMRGQNAPTQLSKVRKAAKRIEITLKIDTEVNANAFLGQITRCFNPYS